MDERKKENYIFIQILQNNLPQRKTIQCGKYVDLLQNRKKGTI